MRRKRTKTCPRCKRKNDYIAYKCCDCGLIFSRVENGSNKLAKELILAGKKDETVLSLSRAHDVSKKQLLLLSGFLGLFGAHNFYVGRFKRAIFQLIIGLISLVCVTLGETIPYYDTFMSFFFLPAGICAIIWVWDFVDIAINKYKMPVAVDFTKEIK